MSTVKELIVKLTKIEDQDQEVQFGLNSGEEVEIQGRLVQYTPEDDEVPTKFILMS